MSKPLHLVLGHKTEADDVEPVILYQGADLEKARAALATALNDYTLAAVEHGAFSGYRQRPRVPVKP